MPSLQAIYHFNIASSLSSREELSYEELADRVGLPTATLRRLVQNAMANRVFKQSRPGYVAHTAASRLLATNPLMHQWVGMASEEMIPATTQVCH